MARESAWQNIPSDLLAEEKTQDRAKLWGTEQRTIAAKAWGDAARQQANQIFEQHYPGQLPQGGDDPNANVRIAPVQPRVNASVDAGIRTVEPPDSFTPEVPGPPMFGAARGPFGAVAAPFPKSPELVKPTEDQEIERRVRDGKAPVENVGQAFGALTKSIGRQGEALPGALGDMVVPNSGSRRVIGELGDTGTTMVRNAGGRHAPVPTGSALETIRSGWAAAPTAASEAGSPSKAERIRRTLVRATTDRGVDLSIFGRLDPAAMVEELSRASPWMAAKVKADETIKPILVSAGKDLAYVGDYLSALGNMDVAQAVGKRVETAAAKRAAPPTLTDIGPVSAAIIKTSDPGAAAQAKVLGQEAAMRRKFSGGATEASSQQAITELEALIGPERYQRVKEWTQGLVDVGRQALEDKVNAGLISRKNADELLEKYPNYGGGVRITDYLKDVANGGTGRGSGLSVRSNGIRHLTEEGTERVRENPINSVVRNLYETEALVKKNVAFNAFLQVRNSAPDLATIFREVPNGYTGTNAERAVTGFVDGVKKTYITSSQDMSRVLRQEGGAVLPGVAPAMQLFKELITARNPSFLVGNAVIDAPLALIRETTRAGGPTALPKVMAALFNGYMDAFSGVTKSEFTGPATSSYLKSGGGIGGFYEPAQAGVEKLTAGLSRARPIQIKSLEDVRRILGDIAKLEPVRALGERVELGPRVAAFNLARDRGEAVPKAVIKGRTTTIDFEQGGYVAKAINQLIPFFNPAMQGAATAARMVKDNPAAAAKTIAATLVGPTLAIEAWNRSDEERAKAYADVPNYMKDRGLIIMLPGPGGKGVVAPTDARGVARPQYIAVTLRDMSLYTTPVRMIAGKVLGDDFRGWGSLIKGMAQQVSPITAVEQAVPPGVSTAVELGTNQDWYRGAAIATEANDERASPFSAAVAGGINSVAGTDVRPSQVEFGTRDVGGFAADAVHGATNIASGRTAQSQTPQDIPIAGSFIRRIVRGDSGQTLNDARDDRFFPPDIHKALAEAGIRYEPSAIRGFVDDLPLKPQEQAAAQKNVNSELVRRVRALIAKPVWQKMGAEEKEDEIQFISSQVKTDAMEAAARSVPPADRRARIDRERQVVASRK